MFVEDARGANLICDICRKIIEPPDLTYFCDEEGNQLDGHFDCASEYRMAQEFDKSE